MQSFLRRSIGFSQLNPGCSVFLITLFFCVTKSVFGQSDTNALPKLLPPDEKMPPTFWEQQETAMLAGILILILLATAVVWKMLHPGPRPVLPPAAAAREALAKCRAQPEDGKVLSEISQILRRYAAATFHFPPGEFTTSEFCRYLERSEQVPPQLARVHSDFLRACDERKFSPAASSAPLHAADRALEIVALTEKETRGLQQAGNPT
jgi:hypothetical protein